MLKLEKSLEIIYTNGNFTDEETRAPGIKWVNQPASDII